MKNEPLGNPHWFWLDLETTGLRPAHDLILEIGAVVTTYQLEEVFSATTLIETDLVLAKSKASAWVLENHERSGLWHDLETKPTLPREQLEEWLSSLIRGTGCARGPDIDGSPIAGFTPRFDYSVLQAQYPNVIDLLSHRLIDVSTVHALGKAWFDTHHEGGERKHRALDDCYAAIDRLRWYRRRHFNPHGRIRGNNVEASSFVTL